MITQLQAIVLTFFKELKTIYAGSSYLFKLFGDATRSAAIAWIVYQSGDNALISFTSGLVSAWIIVDLSFGSVNWSGFAIMG